MRVTTHRDSGPHPRVAFEVEPPRSWSEGGKVRNRRNPHRPDACRRRTGFHPTELFKPPTQKVGFRTVRRRRSPAMATRRGISADERGATLAQRRSRRSGDRRAESKRYLLPQSRRHRRRFSSRAARLFRAIRDESRAHKRSADPGSLRRSVIGAVDGVQRCDDAEVERCLAHRLAVKYRGRRLVPLANEG